jgi:hypothetical protein
LSVIDANETPSSGRMFLNLDVVGRNQLKHSCTLADRGESQVPVGSWPSRKLLSLRPDASPQPTGVYNVCREIPYSAASPVFSSPALTPLRIPGDLCWRQRRLAAPIYSSLSRQGDPLSLPLPDLRPLELRDGSKKGQTEARNGRILTSKSQALFNELNVDTSARQVRTIFRRSSGFLAGRCIEWITNTATARRYRNPRRRKRRRRRARQWPRRPGRRRRLAVYLCPVRAVYVVCAASSGCRYP